MDIYKFKKGDLITREEPIIRVEHYEDSLGIPQTRERTDFDLVGEPLKFNGIEHGCAYFDHPSYRLKLILHEKQRDSVGYTSGWEYYKGPEQKSATSAIFESIMAKTASQSPQPGKFKISLFLFGVACFLFCFLIADNAMPTAFSWFRFMHTVSAALGITSFLSLIKLFK